MTDQRSRYLRRLMRRGTEQRQRRYWADRIAAMTLTCFHGNAVDISTYDDMIRLQGRARVHLCNDCGERIEVPV